MEKTKQLIKATTYEIDRPQQMGKMAVILKDFVIDNNLFVPIQGKNYVMVEGWQFAGGMMGLFPRIVKVENVAPGKWQAQAEIVSKKTGQIMSTGYAVCSIEEAKKRTFDDYAVLSMAQTRAIGKAYRNLIGWVMKMTGYESTPAEEMPKEVKEKKSEKPTLEATIAGIRKSKDGKALVQAMKGITDSKNYTEAQKNVLVNAIETRLTELENGK